MLRYRKRAAVGLTLTAFGLAFPARAQVPLRDLDNRTKDRAYVVHEMVRAGDRAYFTVEPRNSPGFAFVQLWTTDGTTARTRQLVDLHERDARIFANEQGEAFVADGHRLLWVDGKRAFVLSELPEMHSLVFLKPRLAVFSANTEDEGNELWISDGTRRGTRPLRNLAPGTSNGVGFEVVPYQGKVWFSGRSGSRGFELWQSDGTAAGTRLVQDLNPAGSGNPLHLTAAGSRLFFTAEHPTFGRELWAFSGGTARLARDLVVGTGDPKITKITATGSTVHFVATTVAHGSELWVSGGTPASTRLVHDIEPGKAGSTIHEICAVGPRVFYTATTKILGRRLWLAWGTTRRLLPLNGTRGLHRFGPKLAVSSEWISGSGTYLLDPVFLHFTKIADETVSPFLPITTIGGTPTRPIEELVWAAGNGHGNGAGVHRSRGTSATSLRLDPRRIGESSRPTGIVYSAALDRFFFAASDPAGGREPWVSDGTATGTRRIVDLASGAGGSNPSNFTPTGQVVYFNATTAQGARQIWSTTGAAAGTARVVGTPQFPTGWFPDMKVAGPHLFFLIWRHSGWGADLWSYSAGKSRLLTGGVTSKLFVVGDWVYFTREEARREELYRSRGLAGNTELVSRANTSGSSQARPVLSVDDALYFLADDGTGQDLWITRTSGKSITRLTSFRTPSPFRFARFVHFHGEVYFGARNDDPRIGYELHATGPRPNTVRLVADVQAHPNGVLGALAATRAGVFFRAFTEREGVELWITRGTRATTRLVKDINPDVGFSSPNHAVPFGVGGHVLFEAYTLYAGRELWVSDGTEAGTRLVADLNPGPPSSSADEFAAGGFDVLFAANANGIGREPFVLRYENVKPPLVARLGLTDSSRIGRHVFGFEGVPRIGSNGFALTLASAARRTPAALVVGGDVSGAPRLPPACVILPAAPRLVLLVATNATGNVHVPIPLPGDPSLVGVKTLAQFFVGDGGACLASTGSLTAGLRIGIGR